MFWKVTNFARTHGLASSATILIQTLVLCYSVCFSLGCSEQNDRAESREALPAGDHLQSLASLSPGMTELLYELGVGDRLVGISDYCAPVPKHASLTRLGTALTPNYEAIVTTSPDLLVTEAARGAPIEDLRALGGTVEALPWRSTEELVAGIRRIGGRTGSQDAATRLADRIAEVLSTVPDDTAPSVLLAMEHPAGQLTEVWYMADDTLHGDALLAAGGRNAVSGMEGGVPKISLEKVIEMNPEVVLILSTQNSLTDGEREALLADWRQLTTLQAVRTGKLGVVTGDRLFVTGPRILDVVDRIREELSSLLDGAAVR